MFSGFDQSFFAFLTELAQNNDRAWFAANKARYEAQIKAPLLSFIEAMGPRFADFAPCIVADPRGNGGSMFRIYRDTRFSRDKRPYKEHAAAHFRHQNKDRDAHAPGYYLHLEPGSVFAGGGIWMPPTPALTAIRQRIDTRTKSWDQAKAAVIERFGNIQGESLSRAPKGFPADHPRIEDLRRKSFFVGENFTEADAGRANFADRVAGVYRDAAPMMAFICTAQDLDW